MSLNCQFLVARRLHAVEKSQWACSSAVRCWIIWCFVDLQENEENVGLFVPGIYKRLILLAQNPLTRRSICSGVREAPTELAIAWISPRTGSGSELPPSAPLKGLRDLAARRPLAKSAAALLWS